MPDVETSVFQGIEEKIKLDAKIVTSEAKTHLYTEKEEVWNGNLLEIRPTYPNFTITDIAVANLNSKDPEEEQAIQTNAEAAIRGQRLGMKYYEDILVDKTEFVRIENKEKIDKILVFCGMLENIDVLVETKGQKTEKIHVEKQPFFRIIEGKGIPLCEEKQIKRVERHFMNLSSSSTRLHSYVMNRLGLTKSRDMRGAAALHEEHLLRTNVGNPAPIDLEKDKRDGFHT